MTRSTDNIMETIRMIDEECLDIRTVTMGISLLDCADTDIDRSCEKIYPKADGKGERSWFRQPRIFPGNTVFRSSIQRISGNTDFPAGIVSGGDPVKYAKTLDRAGKDLGVNFIGGYSALVQKGMTEG